MHFKQYKSWSDELDVCMLECCIIIAASRIKRSMNVSSYLLYLVGETATKKSSGKLQPKQVQGKTFSPGINYGRSIEVSLKKQGKPHDQGENTIT